MAPEIVVDSVPAHSSRPLRILDPMCGSGTVLSVAAERGHRAVGRDIDPLAVLMSRVATTKVDFSSVLDSGMSVLLAARRSTAKTPLWQDEPTRNFAEFWFGADQRLHLTRISRLINSVSDDRVRMALQVTLSRIIITKAPRASLASDTSHSRPHRTIIESTYDVFEGFHSSLVQVVQLLSKRKLSRSAIVGMGDARDLRNVRPSSVDLLITSPPYLNAIDYMRGHRLALIWLGYSLGELREIRRNNIGAERALKDSDLIIRDIVDNAISPGVDSGSVPTGMVARYCRDILKFSAEARRVVRPGGKAVLVVGNSTLRGNFIQNDLIVSKSMCLNGFNLTSRTERELPVNKRYLPISTQSESSIDGRMRTEVVLNLELA